MQALNMNYPMIDLHYYPKKKSALRADRFDLAKARLFIAGFVTYCFYVDVIYTLYERAYASSHKARCSVEVRGAVPALPPFP